ncbi:hypothetical protein HMPREF3039_01463 [Akkermansia sp. KLE1798]|nr:hypothetical protein HMPREF3039_01463 [Akkermansia sp. KLE1798]KZA04957.1 hypothetical protein HMPREF1326_01539 [Akkermansia sp. KLE1605]
MILSPANFHLRGKAFSWEGVFASVIHSGIGEFYAGAGFGADPVYGLLSRRFCSFPGL